MNPNENIYQKISELTEEYTQSLEKYNAEHFAFKPSEEQWSLGQLYAHVLQTNDSFVKVVNYCLVEQKGQIGGEKTPPGVNIYTYGSFPPVKVKIPIKSLDNQPVALEKEASREALQENLKKIEAILPLVSNNEGNYKVNHVIFGFLNAAEWFQMIEMHMRHHLKQKKELENILEL